MKVEDRLWLPVDVSRHEEARSILGRMLDAGVKNFKVGLELATAIGAPEAVKLVQHFGGNVWYDGKFCDIPNTIAGASKAISSQGVNMFNVHASCGFEAMKAAVANKGNAKILAVTVLTSLTPNDLAQLGYIQDLAAKQQFLNHPDFRQLDYGQTYVDLIVMCMAAAAKLAGIDGIVCSPMELKYLSESDDPRNISRDLIKVTPGVRPVWAAANDQKRVMTPAEAIKAGATALVIGRPITNPPEGMTSADAVKRIYDEIAFAL